MSSHITQPDEISPTYTKTPLNTQHHLSEYYISSSHNTYLQQGQLFGDSSASQYSDVLNAGARCVEIDLWDGENNQPKVTHGWTLTENLSFESVCNAINDSINANDHPVIISLENHASIPQQDKAVEIMRSVFGDKLQSSKYDTPPTVDQLKGKIVVKVEYYPDAMQSLQAQTEHLAINKTEEDSSDSSDDEDSKELRKKKQETHQSLSASLQSLGVVAQSVKPGKRQWWLSHARITDPSNAVINVSETAMKKLYDDNKQLTHIRHTTTEQLVRVYPHGLRIYSRNLDPLPLWKCGAQIVALNYQVFDKGLQLNRALFRNTPGYLLKPKNVRYGNTDADTKMSKVVVRVIGVSGIEQSGKFFFRAKLYTCDEDDDVRHKTKSVAAPNPAYDETFSWVYDESDSLAILRCKVGR